MAITPTKEQFTAFASHERDGEIIMINLLHFSKSDEGETKGDHTGKEAYKDYSDEVVRMVESRGGKVVWTGQPENVLIGDDEADGWDLVALVSYPSRSAFIDMVTSPKYQESHTHRERGLDRTVLLACKPLVNMVGSDA